MLLPRPGDDGEAAAAAALLKCDVTTWQVGCLGREVHVTKRPVIGEKECDAVVAEAEAWAVTNGASRHRTAHCNCRSRPCAESADLSEVRASL